MRDYTGVQPNWLDKPDAAALDAVLDRWIAHAEELVNKFLGTSFDASPGGTNPPPEGVKNGVLRILANMVAQARLRRKTSVINIDEYTQRLVDDKIFTRSIKDDLAMYQVREPANSRLAHGSIGVTSTLGRPGQSSPTTSGDWSPLAYKSTLADVNTYWNAQVRAWDA